MADLSHELRGSESEIAEKKMQIEAMKGWSSKQEISQMRKEVEKQYNDMLEGIKEKISNQLKESLRDATKAQEAREETEKKMFEIHKLSSDEIRKLREQLNQAEREAAKFRKRIDDDKPCTVM